MDMDVSEQWEIGQKGSTGEIKTQAGQQVKPSMGGWSSLPNDLLEQIVKRLTDDFSDCVRVRAICSNWRSFALLHNSIPHPVPQSSAPIPKLLIPFYPQSFFSLNSQKVRSLDLPEACGKICCSSSQGWLVLLERTSPSISLLNPLTRAQIQLPPVTSFPGVYGFDVSRVGNEYELMYSFHNSLPIRRSVDEMQKFISKVVLSPNPTPNNYTAMAIFGFPGQRLAFCKSGQNKWTMVQNTELIRDIIHYKGKFYALTSEIVFVFHKLDDLTLPPFEWNHIHRCDVFRVDIEQGIFLSPHAKYLVELSGELMLVIRQTEFLGAEDKRGGMCVRSFKTTGFEIYKLDQKFKEWVRKESIGDYVLFVGANSVSAILASDCPECRANCIYFTTDFLLCYNPDNYMNLPIPNAFAGHDFGIFNLSQNLVEKFSSCPIESFCFWPPPIWVTASL